jgi:hypothetical protein
VKLKDIKTRSSEKTLHILTDAARAPRELARKSLIESKEKVKEAAERRQPQDESPEQYAENRIEQTAEEAVHRASDEASYQSRRIIQKAKKAKRSKDIFEQQGTPPSRSTTNGGRAQQSSAAATSGSTANQTNAYRAGRERVIQNARSLRQTARSTRYTAKPAQTAERTASTARKAVKTSARTAVKTSQQSVKVAKHTVKTTEKAAIKTAEVSAKLSQKAAQAAAKAAQAAAKAAAAAAKAITAIIKWIVAAVKALVAAIAAGGWVAVVIVVIVALIAAVLCLCFGVFFSNDSAGGMPMTDAIVSIDDGFTASIQARIDELTASADADVVEILFAGDMEDENSSVSNWVDVLGVYSVYATTGENASEVITVTPENIEKLRKVFYDMNSFSVTMETETAEEIEVDEYGAIVLDEDGEPIVNTTTTLYINVEVTSLDYRDGADRYGFDESQMEMLMEIMRPEYYPLFAELCGQTLGDGGEYGLGLDINPGLPDSEMGAQIVQAAKRYIGRSYASMDCSGLVRAAYRDCGLSSMNGLNSASMAKKCQEMGVLFTDPSQLQSGDIIFFARKDARRGEGYCTDHRRCGNGRCKRWMQIHHVAIYINGEFLIDSTGGNNSVQIRKHWGKNGSEWQWICFGRPTN